MTEKIKPYLFSSSFSIVLIRLISLFIVSIFVWNGKDTSVIESDGKGYYAYLPNTFINHNLKTQKSDTRYFKNVNGKVVNKYYVGTSVVMSPFFILGHTVAKLNREKLDGYSSTYQKSISLAGIFYLLFGLIFLRLFLIQFKVPDKTIVLTLFLILFGTNLLSYALFQPSMSHVYSWGFICGFLFFSKMHLSSSKLISFLLAALFLGIIILIRPLNGLIVLILPFLSKDK